jgi:hypothetical protein
MRSQRIATQRWIQVVLAADFIDTFAPEPSLRNGFTAYNVLSPENGSFASVAP